MGLKATLTLVESTLLLASLYDFSNTLREKQVGTPTKARAGFIKSGLPSRMGGLSGFSGPTQYQLILFNITTE